MDTSCSLGVYSRRSTPETRSSESNHSSSECRLMECGVWVQLLKTVNGLAVGTREWRNCFLAAARRLGFETSILEPCVLVLRSTQQKYHGIIGVAVDDVAGGRDEVREQAISKLKQRFSFGHWEVGKGKFCSREVVQAADGSTHVGQLAFI